MLLAARFGGAGAEGAGAAEAVFVAECWGDGGGVGLEGVAVGGVGGAGFGERWKLLAVRVVLRRLRLGVGLDAGRLVDVFIAFFLLFAAG